VEHHVKKRVHAERDRGSGAEVWRKATNKITKCESGLVRPVVVSDMIGILQRHPSAMVAVSICFLKIEQVATKED
jgi:hypothetical protein